MYKVFVNDKPIIITSSAKKENNFPVVLFKNLVLEDAIHRLRTKKIKGLTIYTPNLEADWVTFLSKIDIISAAGGLVLNAEKEILFIYRNGVWDLPKGQIEKGETIKVAAIREVEEECGITNLTILKPLATTYHIYFQNGNKLKQTYWFLMQSSFVGHLTPQLEEGITKAVFISKKNALNVLENTYDNIKLVYKAFLEA